MLVSGPRGGPKIDSPHPILFLSASTLTLLPGLYDSNTPSVFGFSQQNQQLDLAGGCNAFIPRDFVVRGSCSIPTAPIKTSTNEKG